MSRSSQPWDEEVEALVSRFAGHPLTHAQALLLRAVLILAMALLALLVLRVLLPFAAAALASTVAGPIQ